MEASAEGKLMEVLSGQAEHKAVDELVERVPSDVRVWPIMWREPRSQS